MKKFYGHRITKRERAAIDVLYGSTAPKRSCVVCGGTGEVGIGCAIDRPALIVPCQTCNGRGYLNNDRQTPLPGLATK